MRGKLRRDDGVRGWAVVHEDQVNIAKARREMAGPKPMEVDRVADWREWPDDWHGQHSNQGEIEEEHHDEKGGDEAYVQYIGKDGGKKRGKGFQGYYHICGGFGHSQWDCYKGKVQEKVSARTVGMAKVMARMDSQARQAYGKGKGGDGKGGMRKACFGCGSTEHVIKKLPEEHECLASGGGRPRDSFHR